MDAMSAAAKPTYEASVYAEEATNLAGEILAICQLAPIPNDGARGAIIAAAMITAAQRLDGIVYPKIKDDDGVTGAIARLIKRWGW